MRIAALIVAATCWLGACRTAPESFDLVLKSGASSIPRPTWTPSARLLAWDAPLPTSAFGPDAGIIPQPKKPNKRAKVVPIARDPEQFVFVKKNGAPIVSFTKR